MKDVIKFPKPVTQAEAKRLSDLPTEELFSRMLAIMIILEGRMNDKKA